MTITHTLTLSILCPICSNTHYVTVGEEGFAKWEKGELIQNAMPYLSATQREQIISNLCPKCQADIFGEDPEDEGDDISACMRDSLDFTGQWW